MPPAMYRGSLRIKSRISAVSELVLLETSLEKGASKEEVLAQGKWVSWKRENSCWCSDDAKKAALCALAEGTAVAVDAARKAAGRLGIY
jgi:hypothetical protein